MTFKGSDDLPLVRVPDLESSHLGSDGQFMSARRPLNAGDGVCRTEVIKFSHLRGICIPEIDAGAKTHSEYILGTPINEIKVEVIL